MDLQRYGLLGLLAPAVLAGVVLLLGWIGRRAQPDGRDWLGALAVGGGFALGHALFLRDLPSFPPQQATAALFYVACGAVLVGLVASAGWGWRASVARLAVSLATPWLVLRNLAARWEETRAVGELGVLGLGLFAVWSASERWARRRPGASVPLALWLCAAASSWALLLGRTSSYAQLGGVLAATLGAAVVVAWLRPALALVGGAGAAVLVNGALAITGAYIAYLPREAAALLVLAPLAGWLGERGPLARLRPARGALARMLLVALPCGVAVWLAWRSAPQPYEY